MGADIEFKSVDLGKAKIASQLKRAKQYVALVGIPGNAPRPYNPTKSVASEVSLTLAEIALILEKGSPVNHLKPRPFMHKTRLRAEGEFLQLSKKFWQKILRNAADAVQCVKRLGIAYEGEMKRTFTTETFEPNAPITIHGGWMRNHVSGKAFKVEGKKSSRPLIDTGRLRQSITTKVTRI